MSNRVTRSRTKALELSANAALPKTTAVSQASGAVKNASPPRKRARKSNVLPGSTRQPRKGRLSLLPTLPLDVLYEIFGHLSPADLLSLCRTNKAVRGVLLTRQCAFLWRQVLDAATAAGGYPKCPSDMSEPSFALLAYGGPWCSSCGARTSNRIMWNLRRKVCTGCAEIRLIAQGPSVTGIISLKRSTIPDVNVIPWDFAKTEDCEVPHFWEDDVMAYQAELQELRNNSENRGRIDELQWVIDKRRYKEFKARRKYSQRCYELESQKQQSRHDEILALKKARYDEVEARLLAEGYTVADIRESNIRFHKEVVNAKSLTDRVWLRVGPIIRRIVEGVRDQRLEKEQKKRRILQQDMVLKEYVPQLRKVAPLAISFLPTPPTLVHCPKISAIIDDREPDDEMCEAVREALDTSAADILCWLSRRVNRMQKILPPSWPKPPVPVEEFPQHALGTEPGKPLFAAVPTLLVPLDLAIYAYGPCKNSERLGGLGRREGCEYRLFFGLEALAHLCCQTVNGGFGDYATDEEIFPLVPEMSLHADICDMLQLLGYDPLQTTPQDLDHADPRFTCAACMERVVYGWRDVLDHRLNSPSCTAQRHTVQLLTEQEERYVSLCLLELKTSYRMRMRHALRARWSGWGCMHCDAHLELGSAKKSSSFSTEGYWFSHTEIKNHLRTDHAITAPQDGVDMFMNRRFAVHPRPHSDLRPLPSTAEAVKLGADLLESIHQDEEDMPGQEYMLPILERMSKDDMRTIGKALEFTPDDWA